MRVVDGDMVVARVYSAWLCGRCKVGGSCTFPGCTPAEATTASRLANASTLTNEGDTAMAAESSMPSALDLSEKWLCDTGAAYDLVSWDIANKHTDYQSPVEPIIF